MKRCYVVGVEIKGSSDQEIIQECVALCQACEYEVVKTFIQKLKSRDPKMVYRSGKIQELKEWLIADEVEIFSRKGRVVNNLKFKRSWRVYRMLFLRSWLL